MKNKIVLKDIISILVETICLSLAYVCTDHLWSFLLYYICLCFFIAFIKKGIKEYMQEKREKKGEL